MGFFWNRDMSDRLFRFAFSDLFLALGFRFFKESDYRPGDPQNDNRQKDAHNGALCQEALESRLPALFISTLFKIFHDIRRLSNCWLCFEAFEYRRSGW